MNFVALLAVGVILAGAASSWSAVGLNEAVPAFDRITSATATVRGTATTRVAIVAFPMEAALGDSVQKENRYPTAAAGRRDSVSLGTTIDSIQFSVLPKGIIGIKTRNRTANADLDSAISVWYPKTIGNTDTVRARDGANDSIAQIKFKPRFVAGSGALDSLELYPLGLRNGTVVVTAKSVNTGKTLGTITVTVTEQRPVLTAGSILAVPTREEKNAGGGDTGGVRLRWTAPASGAPSIYEVLAFKDSVGARSDSIGYGSARRVWTNYNVDTLTRAGARSDARVTTGTGTVRTAILSNLPDSAIFLSIRGVYDDAFTVTASNLLGSAKAKVSGSAVVRIKGIGVKDTATQSSKVSYPTIAGKVYNGTPQDIGRATLVSGIVDATYGGLDPWDTTYVFRGTPNEKADGDKYPLSALRVNDTGSWTGVARPVDAGLCTTTVIFENKSSKWTRETVFNIAPRPLADGFIVTSPANLTPFTYTGVRVEPVTYNVTDQQLSVTDKRLLQLGRDYYGVGTGDSTTIGTTVINDINVGTASAADGPKIRVKGIGNYTGTATKGFSITPKAIAVDVEASSITPLTYNGTKTIDSSAVTVAFKTVSFDPQSVYSGDIGKFTSGTDSAFTFTATLASADVNSAGVKATVQVSLGKGSVAKNYSLSAAAGRFEKTVTIAPKSVLDTSDFKIPGDTIPTNHLYNGQSRGIGAVTFGYPQPANTSTLTIFYDEDTTKPRAAGQYAVTAVINEVPGKTSNYVDGSRFDFGTYEIGAPLSAVVDSSNLLAATVRSKTPSFALWVASRSPNGGSLSYRWYRNDVLIPGATGARYTPNIDTANSSAEYYVRIINTVPNVQVPDTLESDHAIISVIEAAKTLKTLTVVSIGDSLVYNGLAQIPSSITVTYAGETLSENTDYTLSFANNTNAGSGIVYIAGLDAYKDTILANFPIARRTLVREDFFVDLNRTYNAEPQVLTATVTNDPATSAPRERLGTPTFTYNGGTTAPTNAGKYGVKVWFAQGTNFTAKTADSAFVLDSLVIAKKAAIESDFTYTIPKGHVYTGQTQGIGSVTIKGTGSGKLTVLYDYDPALPVAAGVYTVAVEVEGGDNYTQGIALLGQYKISSEAELVADAKILVESSGYGPVRQAAVSTQAQAVAHIDSVIAALELVGDVTTALLPGAFTAPVAGTDDAPAGVPGSFAFRVVISKGATSDTSIALTLNITQTPVSIASIDRVIPGSGSEVVVVAPVQVVAGEFTVGPNPVAKASGKAGFFWQGKPVKSGTLYVFDGSGNLVKKVAVSDKGISTARREIGAWDIGVVAEGTYLVKGVLVGKDGVKVKVSSLVGVR
jgi:hypothetical protein